MVGIKKLWYKMSVNDVLAYFITNTDVGLDSKEVEAREKKFGLNRPKFINKNVYKFFKYKTLRDGNVKDATIDELVLGDIILLKSGFVAPANLRLIKANKLIVDEEHITGNAGHTIKNTFAIKTLQDKSNQKNMVFASSNIISGRALAIVVEPHFTNKPIKSQTAKPLQASNLVVNKAVNNGVFKSIDTVVFDDLYQAFEVIKSLQNIYLEKGISCVYFLKEEVINKIKVSVPEATVVEPSDFKGHVNGVYFVSATNSTAKTKALANLKHNNILYVYRGEQYEPATAIANATLVITPRANQTAMIKSNLLTDKLNIHSLSSILYNKK